MGATVFVSIVDRVSAQSIFKMLEPQYLGKKSTHLVHGPVIWSIDHLYKIAVVLLVEVESPIR